jgi:RhtB (resistance to homoserine/threonine) family protein
MDASIALLTLLSLVAVDLLAILSPGPSILLVSQTAVERSRWQAIVVGCGITLGSVFWASIALTGLAVLFELVPLLQTAIQVAGAAYLTYIGIRLWRAPATQAAQDAPVTHAAHRALLRGFMTGFLNPKALAYFASIFVLIVPPDAPAWLALAAIAIVAADNLLVYCAAAALFSRPRIRQGYLALRRPIDRICGAIMVALGARLLLSRA